MHTELLGEVVDGVVGEIGGDHRVDCGRLEAARQLRGIAGGAVPSTRLGKSVVAGSIEGFE